MATFSCLISSSTQLVTPFTSVSSGWSAQREVTVNARHLLLDVSDWPRYYSFSVGYNGGPTHEVQVQRKRKLTILKKGNRQSTDIMQSMLFGFDMNSGR